MSNSHCSQQGLRSVPYKHLHGLQAIHSITAGQQITHRPADVGGSVLPEQEHRENAKYMSNLHPWVHWGCAGVPTGYWPLKTGASAGSSSQKHFFLLTKSSAQTFPFCSESLKTLAKPFPLIFLHLAKTTQTVCLQGRLSQDMGEESIICNARKYNLHISKAFSVKTNTQQRLGGQTPIAFKLPCLAIV